MRFVGQPVDDLLHADVPALVERVLTLAPRVSLFIFGRVMVHTVEHLFDLNIGPAGHIQPFDDHGAQPRHDSKEVRQIEHLLLRLLVQLDYRLVLGDGVHERRQYGGDDLGMQFVRLHVRAQRHQVTVHDDVVQHALVATAVAFIHRDDDGLLVLLLLLLLLPGTHSYEPVVEDERDRFAKQRAKLNEIG